MLQPEVSKLFGGLYYIFGGRTPSCLLQSSKERSLGKDWFDKIVDPTWFTASNRADGVIATSESYEPITQNPNSLNFLKIPRSAADSW